MVGCWHGYLSEARCKFAYGPVDPTATYCFLLQEIQIGFGFTFLVPAHLGSPRQNPESRKTVVVVAVVVVSINYSNFSLQCDASNFVYSFGNQCVLNALRSVPVPVMLV